MTHTITSICAYHNCLSERKMNMRFYKSSSWLDRAWGSNVIHKRQPVLILDQNCLTIVIMPLSGIAMRMHKSECRVIPPQPTQSVAVLVPDHLRAYIHRCVSLGLRECCMAIDIMSKTITVIHEMPTAVCKQVWSDVVFTDDTYYIEERPEDISMQICTKEWCDVWALVPRRGHVTLQTKAGKRTFTLTHDTNTWCAAIHVKAAPSKDGVGCFSCKDMAKVMSLSLIHI